MFSFDRRLGRTRDSDDENDLDDEDSIANAIGCLGPLSGFLAPELQKYQKQMKGKVTFLILENAVKIYMTWQKSSAGLCVKAAMENVFSIHIDVTANDLLCAPWRCCQSQVGRL